MWRIHLFQGTNSVAAVRKKKKKKTELKNQEQIPVGAFICAGKRKKSGGLDDKFGGGNVITETQAASVVTSAKLQNADILFPASQLFTTSARKRRMS